MIPYRKCVELGEDLLAGKRKHVFASALNYYYQQAGIRYCNCKTIQNGSEYDSQREKMRGY